MEKINPYFEKAKAHFLAGLEQLELGHYAESEVEFKRSLQILPDRESTLTNLCAVLIKLEKFDEAERLIAYSLQRFEDNSELVLNKGLLAYQKNLFDQALSLYERAIELNADYSEAYNNRGLALQELKRWEEALASYDRAIGIEPDFAKAYNNRGLALQELKRWEAALASYDRAIAIEADFAEAYSNQGVALQELKRWEEALASYERAIEIQPEYDFLLGTLVYIRRQLCDWKSSAENNTRLATKLQAREKVSHPFPILGICDSPQLQRTAAQVWGEAKYPEQSTLGPIVKTSHEGKIKLGYYSADFHNHATAYLMAELFESHDRNQFELFAFSFGPDKNDEMRQRVSSAFDHFIDVRTQSDQEAAQLSRDLGIDIAVDLKGYTQHERAGLFSHRCAPIQVNYLGYPGTMGMPYMDYLIADKIVIPPESRVHYTEKIAYLPHSYQVNDAKRKIADQVFSRQELGLPENAFVFCCFNNNYKITPQTFDSWMRLLKAVSGSVLWLFEENPTAATNLRREAQAQGVEASRLVFAKRMPLPEHLARHQAADLFLDTLPYNAHTTASDALWAGLPVLTLIGESFAGRVAASLLHAIGLPELITSTTADYEAKALELATQPDRLRALKVKLTANRLTTPLFDTRLFTEHIQDAYLAMYRRYQAGLAPEDLFV